MRKFALLLALVIPAACNDDNLGGKTDMAIPADLAASPSPDLYMRVADGVTCGSSTCNSPQVCCVKPNGSGGATSMCVAAGSCGDGGASESCDGPEDCSTGQPNCCATARFSLGKGDMGFTPEGADAICASDADCMASVDLTAGELHTKLCHTASDCVGYSGMVPVLGQSDFDGCCTSTQAPGVKFCAPTQAAGFIMGVTCN
jgi:hypothetical protein